MVEAYFENRKIGFLQVCNFLEHMSYKFLFLSRIKKINTVWLLLDLQGILLHFKSTNLPEIPENYYINLL